MKKKIGIIISVFAIMFAFGAITANAASSGTCGDNVTYVLDDDGRLTISGMGDMKDYGDSIYSRSPFYNKTKIKTVIIKSGVTKIGDRTFEGCSSLTSIEIPDSITRIGDSVFSGCNGLKTVNYNAINCTLPSGNSTQPFYNKASIETVNIGKNVENIPSDLFVDCSGLTSITLPDGVTSIGSSAFYGCSGLTSITIPESVTSIGGYAFYNSGYYNDVSNWENGILYIDNCLIKIKINLTGECVIKDGTRVIAGGAFENCSRLTSIIIPDSVISIGSGAFSGCSRLASITIPDRVTSIGNYAFKYCSELRSVTYNAINCTLPSISSVGPFYNNTSIEIVNIGERVESIPSYLFYGCSVVESITIPESVTRIGYGAFKDCSGLKTVNYNAINCATPSGLFYNNTSIKTVNIGENVKVIPSGLFYGCSGLTSITIPESITNIGDSAFYGCNGLKTVNYNAINCMLPSSSSTGPFYNNTSIQMVNIGKKVVNIPSYLFYGCSGLTSMTIPNSVTSIGDSVFYGCSGLTSITIPNGVTSIGNSVFYGCSGLTSMTIPNGVTSICDSAFYNCSGLITITFGKEVKNVSKNAFYGCDNLETVNIYNLSMWFGISFGNNYANPMCYAKHLYYNGDEINKYNNIVIPDDLKGATISRWAFLGFDDIVSITMPSTGQMLSNIFGEVPDTLIKITITSGDIPDKFANGCTNIVRVNVGSNVSAIGENAFSGCTNLRFLTIEEGVKKISQHAFENCISLSEVTIPMSVTSMVGADVFPKSTVLLGYRGSCAEEYAENYGYTFKLLEAEDVHTQSEATRISNNIVIDTTADVDLRDKILHIALYEADGRLSDYIIVPTKSSQNNAYVVFKDNPAVSYAKIFIWKSLSTITPLSNAETVYVK